MTVDSERVLGDTQPGGGPWLAEDSYGESLASQPRPCDAPGNSEAEENEAWAFCSHSCRGRGECRAVWKGFAGATVAGAGAGALGALVGPASGTLALAVTGSTKGALTLVANGSANALIGVGSTYLDNPIAGKDVTARSLLIGAGAGLAGGYLGGRIAPGNGLSTLRQTRNFRPRTARGLVSFRGHDTRALYNPGFVGGAVGFGGAVVNGLGGNTK